MTPPLVASKTCVTCQSTYTPVSNRQRYCSPECKQSLVTCEQCGTIKARSANSAGRFCSTTCAYAWEKKQNDVECAACGKTFHRKAKTQRYCSFECGSIGKQRRGPCEACGRPRRGFRRFCSRACAATVRAARQSWALGSTTAAGGGYRKTKTAAGWRLSHRLVMEQKLGRPLASWERVHHINGVRDDNDPANLELWKLKSAHPAGIRESDYHCPGCVCV